MSFFRENGSHHWVVWLAIKNIRVESKRKTRRRRRKRNSPPWSSITSSRLLGAFRRRVEAVNRRRVHFYSRPTPKAPAVSLCYFPFFSLHNLFYLRFYKQTTRLVIENLCFSLYFLSFVLHSGACERISFSFSSLVILTVFFIGLEMKTIQCRSVDIRPVHVFLFLVGVICGFSSLMSCCGQADARRSARIYKHGRGQWLSVKAILFVNPIV